MWRSMKKIQILLLVLFVVGIVGPAHSQIDDALKLFKQGKEAFNQGQYQEALNSFERSLKIFHSINHLEGISVNLNEIAIVYETLGQYEKALSYYNASLKIQRENDLSSQSIAVTLNNMGELYRLVGQYDKAFSYFEESLKIRRGLKNPQAIATSLNNIGSAYTSLGQYDKALVCFEEALNIFRELKIPQSITTALNNIAFAYKYLGQYEKALSYYKESLKIKEEHNLSLQSIAVSLNNIGEIYDLIGQYDKALLYYEEALKIRRMFKIPQAIATSYNNIGSVYASSGQYDKALVYFGEALNIFRELKISPNIERVINNIGSIYLFQKKYKEAEQKFLDGGSNEGLIDVYLATERNDEALKLLDKIIPEWDDTDSYRSVFHKQHGMALKGKGIFKEASSEFFKAVSITEEIRQRVKEKTGFFGARDRSRAYKGLISTLAERAMSGEKIDNDFASYGKDLASAAFHFSESTKARTLLEQMAQSAKKSQRIDMPEDLRQKEESLVNRLSAIENQWEDAYKKGEDALKELIKRKEELKKEFDSLITKLRKEYPRYAALNYPKPIPAEELPLKEDEVLLEYAVTEDAGYLFIVRKGGVERLIKIPLTKESLEEKVKAFMGPMNIKQPDKFSIKDAKALCDILLADALKDIKDNEKIIIIPDGILGLLPFESLVMKEGGSIKNSLYVGDRYTISYYQSATVLALQRTLNNANAEKTLFALGNPVYSKEDPRYIAWKEKKNEPLLAGHNKYPFRGLAIKAKWGKTTAADTAGKDVEFQPLPETEIEIKDIAKIMGVSLQQPDILLSVSANETELRRADLSKYRYIHFATHASLPGMIQGVNEPFILLGQVENKDKDDGFFRMSEVLDLKLNADMVVLSACVTGVGKEVEGEGVSNFARAFQHAGAKSVVVSLWEVASEPAVEYMKIFYTHLKAGKSRAEALRLARNTIKAKYHNPFYWAVFILHGEG